MKKGFIALVLAAGKATRFKSEKIKVLYPLLGKSMLQLVLDCLFQLKPERIYVVVGYQKEEVIGSLASQRVEFLVQEEQRGTAHAVLCARSILEKESDKTLLVLNGDMPLLQPKTLNSLINKHHREANALTFLSAELEEPSGFGRIIWDETLKPRVVEEIEATPSQKKLKEVNAGVYLFRISDLLQTLPQVSPDNKKGEYYLTDVIGLMAQAGRKIGCYKISNPEEIMGINTRLDLEKATEILRKRKITSLMEKGVTFYDSSTVWIDLDVKIGRDTTIHTSVIIEGKSVIGKECLLYPFVHIMDSKVGNRVKILTSTVIEKSVIEDNAQIGPFARLRPHNLIKEGARVGNFVEMKNTIFGKKSKAGHLSYLGDCEVKEEVNIGAGTITCNYDGLRKHRTLIEEGAFIGSGTELVAPVKVGRHAYIGAGSTITKDVSPEALAVSRARQIEKPGWAKRKRKGRS